MPPAGQMLGAPRTSWKLVAARAASIFRTLISNKRSISRRFGCGQLPLSRFGGSDQWWRWWFPPQSRRGPSGAPYPLDVRRAFDRYVGKSRCNDRVRNRLHHENPGVALRRENVTAIPAAWIEAQTPETRH